MIYVFLVDTSVSMNTMFSDRLSVLEVAKAGVEHFFKWELRKPQRNNNKYMLVTYQDFPAGFKSILTDDEKVLLEATKTLKATDMSTAGPAMASIFDYLAAYRLRNKIDPPGVGRFPGGHESTLIFWFTDGSGYSGPAGVEDNINIPGSRLSGLEYSVEPFRWEQRLYTIALMPESVPVSSHLTAMSDVMGGKLWKISSSRHLLKCIENCLGAKQQNATNQGIPPLHPISHIEGVSVIMAPHPANSTPKFNQEMLFIYANITASKWFPIPESYWPESMLSKDILRLPRRKAHPTIMVLQRDEYHSIYDGFPVDRFSMEQTSLCQELLKKRAGTCWTIFIENSHHQPGPGLPFGFLKVSGAGNSVNIYILPYNFPKLFKLLNDAKNFRNGAIPDIWTQAFILYMRSVPCYYHQPIRNALNHLNLWYLWPKNFAVPLVMSKIVDLGEKIARQAHMEHQKLVSSIMQLRDTGKAKQLQKKVDVGLNLSQTANSSDLIGTLGTTKGKNDVSDIKIAENVFDVPKSGMLGILDNALKLIFAPSKALGVSGRRLSQRDQDALHTLPISQMGNYTSAMNAMQILRNPLEDENEAAERERTLFGNPYAKRQPTPPPPTSSNKGIPIDPVSTSMDEADEEASQFNDGEGGELPLVPSMESPSSALRRRRLYPRRRSISTSSVGSSGKYDPCTPGSPFSVASSSISTTSSTFSIAKVPRLTHATMPVILVPQLKYLEWNHIASGKFDLAKQMIDIRNCSRPFLDSNASKQSSDNHTLSLEKSVDKMIPSQTLPVEPTDDTLQDADLLLDTAPTDIMSKDIPQSSPDDPSLGVLNTSSKNNTSETLPAELWETLDTISDVGLNEYDPAMQMDSVYPDSCNDLNSGTDTESLLKRRLDFPSMSETKIARKDSTMNIPERNLTSIVSWDANLKSWPDIRLHLHRLIAKWPSEYNELYTCLNMDKLAVTDILDDDQKKKGLAHFYQVAKSFKRYSLAQHIENIIAGQLD
ncbi:hypothetical protein QVD99_000972 [Batrachochytrium dendrobatidis]|nr:hypothetical protein O5D80_008694 [Batrachochytrium dendrobatidis]KAK5673532.1 hypothetical protein QVD99_000972 [Batrachochytrium dendrobatidis]